MNNIFASDKSLNSKYIEVDTTALNATYTTNITTYTNALLVYTFRTGNQFNFFANYCDQEVGLLLAHPTVNDALDPTYRLLWVAVAPNQVLNYSYSNGGWTEFPGGTKLYVHRRSASNATTGKFVISLW